MRRLLLSLTVLAGTAALAPAAHAQVDGFSDPFFLYYGFYLPRQAALAAQPGPEMSIHELSAARQVNALTERAGLYDPPTGLGNEVYDPNHPFVNKGRVSSGRLSASGISNTNISGAGPRDYYNRTLRYYPSLREGRGQNANVVSTRSRGVPSRVPNAQQQMTAGMRVPVGR